MASIGCPRVLVQTHQMGRVRLGGRYRVGVIAKVWVLQI